MAKGPKSYTLDGQKVDIVEFIADNRDDLTKKDLRAILRMRVGDEIIYGGGAAAEFILRRTK